MQFILGWLLIIFPGILYVGQFISSVNFPLAQQLGLQENPKETDQLLQRAEKYTAYWDLLTLIWMPLSGVLMVINSSAWPLFALIGGAIYLDAAGREAVKILSFKHEGVRIGAPNQHRLFFATYFIMAIIGVVVVTYSAGEIWNVL
jgi:cytochrome b561